MAPLAGIRVVDLTTYLPGPMASLLLAQAGAEVIRILPPAGDPFAQADPVSFARLDQGKKTHMLDLKTAEGQAQAHALIATADIMLDAFRPGVLARLGLDDLARRYPRLIHCAITGYGQDGAQANRPGHDLNFAAESGLMALGPAALPVAPVADLAGGTYPALVNILLALRNREQTGQGAFLDVAITQTLAPLGYWLQTGGQSYTLLPEGSPRYALYPTSDGQIVAAAPIEDKFWQMFTQAIGLDRVLCAADACPQATRAAVARLIAAQDGAHWAKVFDRVECCVSVMRDMVSALATSPDARARAYAQAMTHGGGVLPMPLCAPNRVPSEETPT